MGRLRRLLLSLQVPLLFCCGIHGLLDIFVIRIDRKQTLPHDYGLVKITFPVFLKPAHGWGFLAGRHFPVEMGFVEREPLSEVLEPAVVLEQ
jgi:hypothetical protein